MILLSSKALYNTRLLSYERTRKKFVKKFVFYAILYCSLNFPIVQYLRNRKLTPFSIVLSGIENLRHSLLFSQHPIVQYLRNKKRAECLIIVNILTMALCSI
jgi:hypothetical protein